MAHLALLFKTASPRREDSLSKLPSGGAGAAIALVGLQVPQLRPLYDYSWFVGFTVSFAAYYALMKFAPEGQLRAAEAS